MEYSQFEIELKKRLMTFIGPNLLLKIINNPYRYYSLLNPFSFKTKMEQSFLKTQENTYYKFIKECAEYLLVQNNFKLNNSRFKVTKETIDQDNNVSYVDVKINSTFFMEKDNELYLVFMRKRDNYSNNKALEIITNYYQLSKYAANAYKEYKIHVILWFCEKDLQSNIQVYLDFLKVSQENNFNFDVYYGSDFFGSLQNKEEWEKIETHLKTFKEHNYDYFLKMPNLDRDSQTLDFLVFLSENQFNKLISNLDIYKKIRKSLFNENDTNSNLIKALKLRANKEAYNDEDAYKSAKLALEFN